MTLKLVFRYLFALVLVLQIAACSSDPTIADDDTMGGGAVDLAAERLQLANDVSAGFIFPAFDNFGSDFAELLTTASSFDADPSQANLDALRSALKATWLSWQDVELYQFGPMVDNGLRSTMNLYPISATLVESNIASENYNFGALSNTDARGLPTVDYLINRSTSLTDLEDPLRRTYLIKLLQHIEGVYNSVVAGNENYFTEFFTAESSNGTDVGGAISLLVNGMDLHFQRALRDGKVAIPAGVRSAGVPRPTATEALYGAYSIDLLVRALNAYLDLFKGNGIDGVSGKKSISEYLRLIEQADLARDIEAKIEESIQKASALNNDLSAQIEEDVDKVTDLFLTLQEVVTLIKSDMASIIGITITTVDVDGD